VTGRTTLITVCALALSLIFSCASIPKDALKLTHESLEHRQMQSKKYETVDEGKILVACAGLLQDMGFNIDESETELGIIVGSKMRSAVDAGQQVAAVMLAMLGSYMPTDKEQLMRASIVTHPIGETHVGVRVTFQRVVYNTQGQISRREGIVDPEVYREFFNKLSKSVFLEANEI